MIFRGFLKGNSQIMPILGQKYPHRTASASASARKPEKANFRAEVRCGADRADAVRPRGSRLDAKLRMSVSERGLRSGGKMSFETSPRASLAKWRTLDKKLVHAKLFHVD